jgi:MFS family permease
VTSWVTLGAMFGSLAGGYIADHFGRKRLTCAAGKDPLSGARAPWYITAAALRSAGVRGLP